MVQSDRGLDRPHKSHMKIFPLILVGGILSSETTYASNLATPTYMDSYIGTETAAKLQQEFHFLEDTTAKLLSEGAGATINYMWNAAHTAVVFYSVQPPSGTTYCRFWAYRQQSQEQWTKVGEYAFCTKFGAGFDWEHVTVHVRSDGFRVSFLDGDSEVSYFYSFNKKEDDFYYKMMK